MEEEGDVKEIVEQIFTDYLTAKKCRKTPERYAILDLIYSETGHFNMDSLYDAMNKRHFRVSRATLYNTMQLLLECNLVLKHQFGHNLSVYERAYNND
ncbi:MAG: transcriptional repressor, partial [Dysgonamonadaceae bacterium]|nr:transcriptional repressor [Dysgonamonadaceae bacterium]